MLQSIMTAPGQIEMRDSPIPELKKGEVLVKIMRIGICGSDIHVYHGKHPYTTYPVVQGHEVSGRIEKTAVDVSSLKIGDKVTIQPQVVCGSCFACLHGRYNICDELKVMGFQTTGMASEYFAVNADKIVKIPDHISFDEGAMVEPLAVAVHALHRSEPVKEKNILVLGAGPIGNLIAQTAKGLGAKAVMITDISDFRLKIARECGIDFCVNTRIDDLDKAIVDNFGPDKADLILECVGANTTIEQAILKARKGTDIIVVGVFGDKPKIDMGLIQDRELRIIGTLMYRKDDYIKAVDLLDKGIIKVKPLVTDHFVFNDYIKAYEHIDAKGDQAMKTMMIIQEEEQHEAI